MEIKTKFGIGDIIYIIEEVVRYETCVSCNGKGDVDAIINNEKVNIKCPTCRGFGRISSENRVWRVVKERKIGMCNPTIKVIYRVHEIIIREDGIDYVLILHEGSKLHYVDRKRRYGITLREEDGMFSSIEEAQKECDRRNGER